MTCVIRPARPEEFAYLGEMTVQVYSRLDGMPTLEEQPDYYNRLRDVQARASNPAIQVFAAVNAQHEQRREQPRQHDLYGCVDFITDMQHYASGGTAPTLPDSAGIRLLAVQPEFRKKGIGRALTEFCIQQARDLGRSQVILHTTRAMGAAWRMYETMGFVRFPPIDFQQGRLEVFGFSLRL